MLLTGLLAMLTVLVTAPQALRCWRLQTTDGISHFSQTLCLAAAGAWFAYGVLTRDAAQLLTNAIDGSFTVAVLVALCRFGGMPIRSLALRSAGVTAALLALIAVSGITGMLLFAIALVSTWHLPQVWLAWRKPGGLGLSVVSLALSVAINIAWMAYGLNVRDYAVAATAAWSFATTTFIAIRTVTARRKAAVFAPIFVPAT